MTCVLLLQGAFTFAVRLACALRIAAEHAVPTCRQRAPWLVASRLMFEHCTTCFACLVVISLYQARKTQPA